MKHPFFAIMLFVHLLGAWGMWKLNSTDDANNGNFIGVGLIAALLAITDLSIGAVIVFRWLF